VYYWDDQIKKDEIDRAFSMRGEMRNAYKVFAGKAEGKTLLRGLGVDGMVILQEVLGRT
jgi:hypothetical protein